VNHSTLSRRITPLFILHQERLQARFVRFQDRRMSCETDYLYLAFLMRYQGQTNFLKIIWFFTPTEVVEQINTNPATINCVPVRWTVYVISRPKVQEWSVLRDLALCQSCKAVHGAVQSCTLSRDMTQPVRRNGTQFMVAGFLLICSTAFVGVKNQVPF
jgi:hypothetical protein